MDLFAAADAARDEGIARADSSVRKNPDAEATVRRVTDILLNRMYAEGRREFTADEVGGLLDALGVATDQATRKRLASTIINRGKNKRWRAVGFTRSHRRHSAPIALWELM